MMPWPLSRVLICSGSERFQRAGGLGAVRSEGVELPYDFISVLTGEEDWVWVTPRWAKFQSEIFSEKKKRWGAA